MKRAGYQWRPVFAGRRLIGWWTKWQFLPLPITYKDFTNEG